MRFSRSAPLGLALVLSACGGASPREQEAEDARAVAQVEALQTIHPAIQPLQPRPIHPAARRMVDLGKGGCEFRPDRRSGAAPVFIAGRTKALLLIADGPVILAADSGSYEIRSGARAKYTARSHWAQILTGPEVADGESEGQLILRDRYDRVVYSAAGRLSCAPAFAP